jgi:LPXTG-motif cell wall-anchored protein
MILLLAGLVGLESLLALLDGLATGEAENIVIAVFGLAFSGIGAVIVARRLVRPNGFIEIQPLGVLIECYALGPFSGLLGGYFVLGKVPWGNLTKIEEIRAQWVRCLGISLSDVASFLSTKDEFDQKQVFENIRLGNRFARLLMYGVSLGPFGKFTELFLKIFGFSGLPASASEADSMDWNKRNYGSHILIPGIMIPGGVSNVRQRIIDQRARLHTARGIERLTPATVSEANKQEKIESRSVKQRLIEVEELFRNGLLSHEEYRRKREKIISDL